MSIKRTVLPFTSLYRKYGTNPKPAVSLEQSILKDVEEEKIKPRQHPGRMKLNPVKVPEKIVKAMQIVIQDNSLKTLCEQAKELNHYLKARHKPPEKEEMLSTMALAKKIVENKYGVNNPLFGEEEEKFLSEKFKGQVQKVFKQHLYNWQPIEYDRIKSVVYLIGRSAAEYAVLCKIFSEICKREPNFRPQTVLDFGSGVGTVTWAVDSFWNKSVKEYFCVDSSRHMNDIASLLVRDGNADRDIPKGFFYRQFLPALHVTKYDIVVSAYSLMELPSTEARLETVHSLWSKTSKYFVIVEQGTNAGFQVVNEARDYILHLAKNSSERLPMPSASVFAPCPHDNVCPRMLENLTPCNFEIRYETLPIGSRGDLKKELFSYVVLEKGERQIDGPQWPRIVRPTLVRSKHTICRMCTPGGKLSEIVFTASKHGKATYRCARASHWGDLLPINFTESLSSEKEDKHSDGDESPRPECGY